jgi:WD40 repeat protein
MRRTILSAAVVCLVVSLLLSLNPPGRAQAQKARADANLLLSVPHSEFFWWSPDGKTLAVAVMNTETETGGLLLYDAVSAKPRAEIKNEAPSSSAGVYFTPDGRTLIAHEGRVALYDAGDSRRLREFGQGTEPINLYRKIFVPVEEETRDYTGQTTTTLKQPSNEDELKELPTRYLSGRVVSPNGKSLLVRGREGAAQVYDLTTGRLQFTLERAPDAPPKKKERGSGEALGEFSPDGKLILTTHRNRKPRLWNAETGALVADLGPQSDRVIGARFSSDGKFVATSTFGDGVVKIWEAATGKLKHTIGSDKDRNYFAAWNPANNTFVTKTLKWEVNIWDAETGALVARLDNKAAKEKFDHNLTFVYSPDGKILVTEGRGLANFWSVVTLRKKVPIIAYLWDAATGKFIAPLRDTKKRRMVIKNEYEFFWSPAGDHLVTSGVAVQVWSRGGELLQGFDINAEGRASLSPDGKLLAFLSSDYGLGAAMADVAKLFIGKLPKLPTTQTHVWQIAKN